MSRRLLYDRKLLNYNLLSRRLVYDRKLSQWLQNCVHAYVHFSVFRSFTVCCEQFFMFFNFSLILSMVGCKSNLRAFGCNLRNAK